MLHQKLKLLFACVLVVVCAAGINRAVKTASVSYTYRKVRYGQFNDSLREGIRIDDPAQVIRFARHAENYFPEYHNLFAHTASIALDEVRWARDDEDYEAFKRHLGQAYYFSRLSLACNPYSEQARRIYADTLAEDGRIAEAIEYWRSQVLEVEFWRAINHDKMADLLLRSNDPEHLREAARMAPPPGPAYGQFWLVRDHQIRRKLVALQKIMR